MYDFSDQTVLVTGAGSGIGLGIARAFYETGARIALGDFRDDALEQARTHFPNTSRVHFQHLDVRDQQSVASFVQESEAALGPVSIPTPPCLRWNQRSEPGVGDKCSWHVFDLPSS